MLYQEFSEAVSQLLPDIDQEAKDEILEKVTGHMIQFMKEKVYKDNLHELDQLTLQLYSDPENKNYSIQYQQAIATKFDSLSPIDQQEVMHQCETELTRVMHEIYVVYNS